MKQLRLMTPCYVLSAVALFLSVACQSASAPAPSIGTVAPDVILNGLDGGIVKLSDFQGKPVLINFWATWCVPCRAEMPAIVEASKKYEKSGLVVLAVDVQEDKTLVQPFVNEFSMPFPVGIDSTGEAVGK